MTKWEAGRRALLFLAAGGIRLCGDRGLHREGLCVLKLHTHTHSHPCHSAMAVGLARPMGLTGARGEKKRRRHSNPARLVLFLQG